MSQFLRTDKIVLKFLYKNCDINHFNNKSKQKHVPIEMLRTIEKIVFFFQSHLYCMVN